MPLNLIPNQPLFQGIRPTNCFSCDERQYCAPFIPDDILRAQFQQTPCNDSIVCDSRFISLGNGDNEVIPDTDFSDLGPDQVLNGTFTGNANGWTLQTGWAYNTNKVTKSTTAGQAYIFQLLANALVIGGIYEVKFTVANYGGSGTLQPSIGGAGAGASFGTQVSANGSYTQYIKCGTANNTIFFFGSAAFTGDLDSISVKRIAETWDFGFWFLNPSRQAVSVPGPGNRNLTCPGVITQPNTDYVIEIDFDASSVGGFECILGSNFSTFNSSTGGGTITLTVNSGNSGNDFAIVIATGAVLVINSVSVKTTVASGECWTFDNTKWTLTTEMLCKLPGSSDNLVNSTSIDAGTYYQFKITVSGRTAGSITASVADATGDLISTNGTFTQYFLTNATGLLNIFADAEFDGCVSVVLLYELKQDYIFQLQDLDGNLVSLLTAQYDEDYVTINKKMSLIEAGDFPLPFGCYRVHVFDQCELQYAEIIGDGRFDNAYGKYWIDQITGAGGATITITAGNVIFDYPSGQTGQIMALFNCRQGVPDCTQEDVLVPRGAHNYKVEFDVIENTDPSLFFVSIAVGRQFTFEAAYPPGHYTIYFNNFDPSSFYDNPPSLSNQLVGFVVRFTGPLAGRIRVDNVSMHRIEPYDSAYVSECIKYDESFKCTTVVEAECDADNSGFKFYDKGGLEIFKLSQRIYLRAINPSYPEDTEDYTFSDGTKSRNYGKSEKSFIFITDALPEAALDALRIQRIMQRFKIGEPENMIEWFPLPSDMVPEWIKNGDSSLASVRFEIQEKIKGAKFFRNS